MPFPTQLPNQLVELIADRFAVLAEPMRIRLLNHLRVHGEASVGELTAALGANQQNVSKHLSVLADAGITSRRKHGTRCAAAFSGDTPISIASSKELRDMPAPSATRCPDRWPLERVLFALAGTMTLVAAALSILISPWFLLLAALVGASQWSFVLVGDCPTSVVLRRLFGLRGATR
jgi:DNA-binding transcriptional ArsR family regulator